MSDEPFMRDIVSNGLLNNFRLFANYGIAGSYPPPFEYQRTVAFNSFLGNQAASFGNYGNPDLAPEKKHSYEAGFNVVLFNQTVNLGFTYYYALTKDALFSIPSLPSSGQEANYLANAGEIENKGIELSLGLQLVNTRDWNVRLNASFNTNKNKVLDLGTAVPFAVGGFSTRTVQTAVAEGKSVGFIRGYKAVLNPDNTLKEVLPLQDLGQTLPKGYGNFSLFATYKNLTFMMNGDYQYGGHVHSFDRQFRFSKGLKDDAIPRRSPRGTGPGCQLAELHQLLRRKVGLHKNQKHRPVLRLQAGQVHQEHQRGLQRLQPPVVHGIVGRPRSRAGRRTLAGEPCR